MKRAIILILCLLLTVKVVSAQDDFPPDPSEIFTDAVEVVSVETRIIPEDTAPTSDDTARIIRIYDFEAGEWHEFDYPEGVNHIDSLTRRSDGTIVAHLEAYSNRVPPPASTALIFNPDTEEYTAPESVCDDHIKDLEGQGEWRFYHSDEGIFLCFTETGEMIGELPLSTTLTWVNYSEAFGRNLPARSPDGDWFLLLGQGEEPDNIYAEIYGFQPSTQVLNYLGRINNLEGYDYLPTPRPDWISGTQGLVQHITMGDWMSDGYYTFDLSQPNSLESVEFSMGLFRFYNNPPRFETMITESYMEWNEGFEAREHINCTLTTYDERGVKTYDLGYDCQLREEGSGCMSGAVRIDDDYFYLRFDEDRFATLVRLDTTTETFTEIISANDFASLMSVSPDGRYAVLLLGSRPILDYEFGCLFEGRNYGTNPNRQLAIYDIVNNIFVYQTESYNGGEIIWLQDNQVFILTAGYFSQSPINAAGEIVGRALLSSLRLVTLSDDGGARTISQHLRGDDWEVLEVAPNTQQMIARQWGYYLIDMTTATATLLIKRESENLYHYNFAWNEDGSITVSMNPQGNWRQTATYIIRVIPTSAP